jgi:hypothetical protein
MSTIAMPRCRPHCRTQPGAYGGSGFVAVVADEPANRLASNGPAGARLGDLVDEIEVDPLIFADHPRGVTIEHISARPESSGMKRHCLPNRAGYITVGRPCRDYRRSRLPEAEADVP